MKKENRLVIIKTDGASKGNPGPAGIGYHIDLEDVSLVEDSDYIGTATNNEAEYLAVINALESALELNLDNILLQTDSNLLVQQLLGNWQVKSDHIRPLRDRISQLSKKFGSFRVEHIRREFNKKADMLANIGVKVGHNVSGHVTHSPAPKKILPTMPFGKHKGLPFYDIPTEYLRWLYREGTNLSDDLKHTLKTELKKRGVG